MEVTNEQNLSIERPLEVTRGVQILYASLGIGFISSIVGVAYEISGSPIVFALIPLILFFGLFTFVVFQISKGRNWARIIFLVITLIGLPFAIPTYAQELKNNLLLGSLSIFITLLDLAGIYLLFRKNSNLWFKMSKQNSKANEEL